MSYHSRGGSPSRSRMNKEPEPHTSQEDYEALERKALETGPLSLLTQSVKDQTQIMVHARNNRKLIAKVKAFDRHCNLLLENVREFWTEAPKGNKGKPAEKERWIPTLFLRGDSVILAIRNPLAKVANTSKISTNATATKTEVKEEKMKLG